MKKILVWTAILLGLVLYMKFSSATPTDMFLNQSQVAGASTQEGKTFGMILPARARAQLRS